MFTEKSHHICPSSPVNCYAWSQDTFGLGIVFILLKVSF